MSKYYKVEDVIDTLADQWHYEATIDYPYAADDIEEWKENARELYADLPSIEVSEDCIERDLIISQLLNLMSVEKEHYEGMDKALKLIEHAPSVVPQEKIGTRKEEEKQSVYGKKIRLTCCECGDVVDVSEAAYPYEKYCRYCGAKMKG